MGILRVSIALLLVLSSISAQAGTPPPADEAFRLKVTRDEAGLTLGWTIGAGSYLYRAMIAAKDAMPPGATIKMSTSRGEPKDDPDFGLQEVYHDTAKAEIASADLQGLNEIVVTYQGCAEQYHICYPPILKTIDLRALAIKVRDRADSSATSSSFVDTPQDISGGPGQGGSIGSTFGSATDLSSWVTLGGMLATFFGFGLLLSFSPCTFPMVPIFFGLLARSEGRPSGMRGLGLAIAFVGASAAAYSLLGAFSAWSGSGENLQVLLQTPVAIGIMSTVLVVFALSMFGLFEIRLPAGLIDRISGQVAAEGRSPIAAALALGFGSALIAGPCVTPPLATALLYVARTGEVARGMAALFIFGVGMGVPLLVFGALGPRFLPKPGPWLVRMRELFGFVMLGLAIWMVSRVLSEWLTLQLWGALTIGLAIYFGLLFLKTEGLKRIAWAAPASLALLVSSTLLIGSAGDGNAMATRLLDNFGLLRPVAENGPAVIRSMDGLKRELAAARADGKPMMVDVSADWCVECRLMDTVLRRLDIRKQLEAFRTVRADVTAVDTESRALMQHFKIVGPPTILLFGPHEDGDPTEKIVGAVDADALLAKLSTVAAAD
ncbi:hypothetical protein AS156_23715 [Bradyrhizobium macuxiense]|uniref:Thioredoxin domain-containing protein n=1 Tax=Bradyrhizobium macuxiense TaxID=1755647 RepID=A0A109JB23_9BRAD|nr:protein-disulfide reductase DsbD [Bradyrhizobium macuxiense]KWV45583.1 hypothetical protein AS156_23715 [Bradyrhizobium macuxiense]